MCSSNQVVQWILFEKFSMNDFYEARIKVKGIDSAQPFVIRATGPQEAEKLIRILFGAYFENFEHPPHRVTIK